MDIRFLAIHQMIKKKKVFSEKVLELLNPSCNSVKVLVCINDVEI